MIIDKNIHRKSKMISEMIDFHEDFPLFSSVEIDVINKCNRVCGFCPVSIPGFRDEKKLSFLEYAHFKNMLADLAEVGYLGSIVFSGLSEPLLLKNIEKYIYAVKEMMPGVVVEIITNGDPLSVKKMRTLFNNGLDRLLISMYDGEAQVNYFSIMCDDAGVEKSKVVLRRRYYKDGDYGINLSNRGGMIDVDSYKNDNTKLKSTFPLERKCFYPFYMLKVDYDGDVTICSHDWKKTMIVGNVIDSNIVNIWKSNHLERIRKSLSNHKRNFRPCDLCDVEGDLIGKDHFNAFMSFWN